MAEFGALVLRCARDLLRGRAARACFVLFALGLAGAAYAGSQVGRGAGLTVLGALLVPLLLAAGAAVAAGATLPEDRIAGREEWLATLAPPAWKRRVAAALTGWGAAVALGLGGGLVAGVVVALVRPDAEPRAHRPVPVPAGAAIARPAVKAHQGPPLVLTLPSGAVGDEGLLEVDVRPHFHAAAGGEGWVVVDRVTLAWRAGAAEGTLDVSVRGPIRLAVPRTAAAVVLASRTPGVTLRVAGARLLGGARSLVLVFALAGLLLGVLAGTAAPVAVLVSRGTSAQTAVAAAASLLLFGALRPDLLALASDLDAEGLARLAPALLGLVACVAPDVPVPRVLGEIAALRAPGVGALDLLLPALAWTLGVLLLVAAPVPARWRSGGGA